MNFDQAIALYPQVVGGWDARVLWPQELGGVSRGGIHQQRYNLWQVSSGLTTKSVNELSAQEMLDFLNYCWSGPKIGNNIIICEALAGMAGFVYFQINVEHGEAMALKLLQQALLVPASGNFEGNTQQAFLQGNDHPDQLAYSLLTQQLAFYSLSPAAEPWQTFRLNRINLVRSLL